MLLSVRILAWRARRLLLVVGLVGVACLVARQAAPPGEPMRDVVVAARDLTAGDDLTRDDLRVVAMPRRLVPSGTLDADQLPGRRVTASVPAGLPLVAGLVGGLLVDGVLEEQERFGVAAPAGTVTVPVRLVDAAVARLLRPGDRVDLVAPDGAASGADPGAGGGTDAAGEPGVLARAALVLDVMTTAQVGTADDGGLAGWAGAGGADGGSGGGDEPLVVVAVAPAEGHRLAAAGWGSLGAVMVQGS